MVTKCELILISVNGLEKLCTHFENCLYVLVEFVRNHCENGRMH